MPIGPYIVDFACFSEHIVIEVDGGQHSDARACDDARTKFIEAQGYEVLRFWNSEVLANTRGVLERVAESLSLERGKKRKLREGEDGIQSTSPSHASGAGPSLSQGRGGLTIRNLAKGAGAVVIGLIALDLVATVITLAVGVEFLKR